MTLATGVTTMLTSQARLWPHGIKDGNLTRQPDRPAYAWIERPADVGLRLVGYADEIVKLRHTGWYSNEDMDETFRGVVYRLPHSRGFIGGRTDPWNDEAAFVCLSPCATERDAAYRADSVAQYEAETERDYQEREREEFDRVEREGREREEFVAVAENERPDMYRLT